MTQKEKNFIKSIDKKIKKYNIDTTIKEVLDYYSDYFLETTYNDGKKEIVDAGIEYFLCQKSSVYFLSKYGFVNIPGKGVIPFNLYYFQRESLKIYEETKKSVFLKTRQCLTEDNYVMTDKGYVSIKDAKPGDKIETIKNGKSFYTLIEDWMDQGEREVCRILTNSGAEVKCTLDHKLLTKDGWKEAKDLTLKDEIVSLVNRIGIKNTEDLTSKKSSNQSLEKVRKIERLEEKENVYDITTTTSDFLANGLVVHNCGISTVSSLYCFWKGNFQEGENIDVVSIKQQKAQAFVSKIEETIKRMPEFLKTPIINKNSQMIKWENGSQIVSESASENAGRSDSLSLLILDEAAFYKSDRLVRGIVASAQPTLSRTGGSMIIISTPNGQSKAGAWYYEVVNDLKTRGNNAEEKLIEIDWFEVPDINGIYPYKGYNDILNKYIERDYFNNPELKLEMKKHFEEIENNWQENDWLKKQMTDLGEILFKQEILHSFIVGDNQVFPETILNSVKKEIDTFSPIWKDELKGVQMKGLYVWDLPIPKHRYIMGIDSSSGTSSDYSAIQVMDVENYSQVAEFKGKVATKTLGLMAKKIARFYNQAFIVVETNNMGAATFQEIYYSDNDPYENVYKQKKMKDGVERFTGWDTNVKTRQLLTNELVDWFIVEDLFNRMTVKSRRLYEEMTTWVYKNGRIDHADSSHDDALIAWGLCIYLRNEATNFGESFFIAENGEMIGLENKKDLDSFDEGANLGFAATDQEFEDIQEKIIEETGVSSIEEYKWLIN